MSLFSQLSALRSNNKQVDHGKVLKNPPTLLFTPEVARDQDIQTIHALALTGLQALIDMNDVFKTYEATLFGPTAINVSRELLEPAALKSLDESISFFLIDVSPYFLLRHAHKTLEFLLRHYLIHLHNTDDLLTCILPFYETPFFTKLVQQMHLKETKWAFLCGIQKEGALLPRSVLVDQCLRDDFVILFAVNTLQKMIQRKKNSNASYDLKVALNFFLTLVIETLKSSHAHKKGDMHQEAFLLAIVPLLVDGLAEPDLLDFKMAALMMTGFLVTRVSLSASINKLLLKTLIKNISFCREDSLMCLNLFIKHQGLALSSHALSRLYADKESIPLLGSLSAQYNMLETVCAVALATIQSSHLTSEMAATLTHLLRDVESALGSAPHFRDAVLKPFIVRLLAAVMASPARAVLLGECFQEILNYADTAHNTLLTSCMEAAFGPHVGGSGLQTHPHIGSFIDAAFTGTKHSLMAVSLNGQSTQTTLSMSLHSTNPLLRKAAALQIFHQLAALSQDGAAEAEAAIAREFYLHAILELVHDPHPAVAETIFAQEHRAALLTLPAEPLAQTLFDLITCEATPTPLYAMAVAKLLVEYCRLLPDTVPARLSPILFQSLCVLSPPTASTAAGWAHTRDRLVGLLTVLRQFASVSVDSSASFFHQIWQGVDFSKLLKLGQAVECEATLEQYLAAVVRSFSSFSVDLLLQHQVLFLASASSWVVHVFFALVAQLSFTASPAMTKAHKSKKEQEALLATMQTLLALHSRWFRPAAVSGEGLTQDSFCACGVSPPAPCPAVLGALARTTPDLPAREKSQLAMLLLGHVISVALALTPQCKAVEQQTLHAFWKKLFVVTCAVASEKGFGLLLARIRSLFGPTQLGTAALPTFLASIYTHPHGNPLVSARALDVACTYLNLRKEEVALEFLPFLPHVLYAVLHAHEIVRHSAVCLILALAPHLSAQTEAPWGILFRVIADVPLEMVADPRTLHAHLAQVALRQSQQQSQKKSARKARSSSFEIDCSLLASSLAAVCLAPSDLSTPIRIILLNLIQALPRATVAPHILPYFADLWASFTAPPAKAFPCFPPVEQWSELEGELCALLFSFVNVEAMHMLKKNSGVFDALLQSLCPSSLPAFHPRSKPFVALSQAAASVLTPEFMSALPSNMKATLVKHLVEVLGVEKDKLEPDTVEQLRAVLTTTEVPCSLLTPFLDLAHGPPPQTPKRRKVQSESTAAPTTDADVWLEKVALLLEILQYKTTLTGPELLVCPLFALLEFLVAEEARPTPGEGSIRAHLTNGYLLHLCLTATTNVMTLVPPTPTPAAHELKKNAQQVEMLVRLIQTAPRPQTQTLALQLLAAVARHCPTACLALAMPIFTHLGSAAASHDNAHTFEIAQEVVRRLVPVLAESGFSTAKCIAIFASNFFTVAPHRRLPLWLTLAETVGDEQLGAIVLALLKEQAAYESGADETVADEDEDPVLFEFCRLLLSHYSAPLQVAAVDFLFTEIGKSKEDLASTSLLLCVMRYLAVFFESEVFLQQCATLQPTATPEDAGETTAAFAEFKQTIRAVFSSLLSVVYAHLETAGGKPDGRLVSAAYEVLAKMNDVTDVATFVGVVEQLLTHPLHTIRRRSLVLLNERIDRDRKQLSEAEETLFVAMVPQITALLATATKTKLQRENVLDVQTTLLSLEVLTRAFAANSAHARVFSPAVPLVLAFLASPFLELRASAFLTLSSCTAQLGTRLVPLLPKFLPLTLSLLENYLAHSDKDDPSSDEEEEEEEEESGRESEEENSEGEEMAAGTAARGQAAAGEDKREELAVLAAATPDAKQYYILAVLSLLEVVVARLPQFLSPHTTILLSCLTHPALTDPFLPTSAKVTAILTLIAKRIQPRFITPSLPTVYSVAHDTLGDAALQTLMFFATQLAKNLAPKDLKASFKMLFKFFLHTFDTRRLSRADNSTEVETHILEAFLALVLRLSERDFKPLFLKIVDWAGQGGLDDPLGHDASGLSLSRQLFVFRLSRELTKALKVIFVPYWSYLADWLAAHLPAAVGETAPASTQLLLADEVALGLTAALTHDSDVDNKFLTTERFKILFPTVLNLLTFYRADGNGYLERIRSIVAPCVCQLLVASGSDTLWKPLNYQLLLHTRSDDAQVRRAAVETLHHIYRRLGEGYLLLLPDTIPFLAEMLEDEDHDVEIATKSLTKTIEIYLGESITQYFTS